MVVTDSKVRIVFNSVKYVQNRDTNTGFRSIKKCNSRSEIKWQLN